MTSLLKIYAQWHWRIKGGRKRFGPGTAKPYGERNGAFLLSDNHPWPKWWANRVERFRAAVNK